MKKLMSLCLLALTVCCLTACPFHKDREITANYYVYINFQDASGNDLVEGIETENATDKSNLVKSDLYMMDIIASEAAPCKVNYSQDILHIEKFDNRHYLTAVFGLSADDDCPEPTMLVYRLSCPYIFGDRDLHKVVTYWDIPPKEFNMFCKCTRIEFEGKEYIPNSSPCNYGCDEVAYATITVDSREAPAVESE